MVNQPPEVQFPASPENYTGGRDRTSIDMIVLHKEQGTNGHLWFQNPAAQVSAHCCIEHDGTIYRCVDDGDTAWQAGKWDVNLCSLGIEHAGYAEREDVTPEQYEASAQLVAYWAQTYGIPLQHAGGGTQGSWTGEPGVIYHYEVPPPNDHSCPGRTLDMERIIARAQEIIGGN
jgi:N-acetyl-anhydromuramyl-L-alanine amidase AmpD